MVGFRKQVGVPTISGDLLVIVGFVMLTIASWKEISEGNEDDEVDAVSTFICIKYRREPIKDKLTINLFRLVRLYFYSDIHTCIIILWK